MSKKSFLDALAIKSPCTEDWNKMTGNNKVRACSHCATSVNDISQLTFKEAMRLVESSNGSICIRYASDPRTNRPLFAEQLHRITRRAPGIAAGVMTASIALSTQTYAQSGEPARPPAPAAVEKTVKGSDAEIGTSVTTRQVVDLPIQGTPMLMGAVSFSSLTILEYKNPLIVAVNVDDLDLVRVLLGSGSSVRAKEQDGTTALAVAVHRGNLAMVRYLLDAGAKVNVANKAKRTPLMEIDGDTPVELVQLLILHGAKVNVKDEDGDTPLIIAARRATADVLKILLDAGAEVNVANSEGETPLMAAAYDDDLEKVRHLLLAGAEVNVKDKEGETAWDKTSNDKVEELLVVFGAIVDEADDSEDEDGPPVPSVGG